MGDMTTFGNNDSVFSHGEDSISMLNRLAKIAKEAYKYIPENDCTVECGTFVDVDTRVFLSAVQHFRESIEAYRDLTEELDDDLRECRAEYEDAEKLFEQLNEDCDYFQALAISRNKELEDERKKSTQLEQRIKVLTAERDLAKKLAKQKSEELKRKLNEKYGTNVAHMELEDKLDRKCREVGELTSVVANLQYELDRVYEKIELIKADRDRYFKQLYESGYFDTDIAHMYPKTTLKPNNPQNFCGNCRHYAQMGKDDGDFEGICTQHFIKRVDPDDASCSRFESNQVDRDKPDQPCCEACNRDDCDNCALCPF